MSTDRSPEVPVAAFDRDGFARIPGFLASEEIRDLVAEVDRFIAELLPRLPREHIFREDVEDGSTLKQIQQMGAHAAYFRRLQNEGRFREVAERLLDGPVVPKNLQYFNKPAGVGRPTPPHQDGYYFMLEPCEAVTMWLALDVVDEENGCVRYVPGSHREGLRPHRRTDTLGFSQGIADDGEVDLDLEVPVRARPGDLLVHHAMTIHRADGNRSADRSRRALGFIYYSERAREDAAAHAAYQAKLRREMLEAKKI